ncbi:uncharacterized protein EKO05_0009823 [Ascochyta rabiei]|uniref:Uncharacterized protein n=1 Tax=Didymella rabiei TaxID=5454 RepID=A0A162YHN3_DIDRA|nr:uncharacterized protein EKO05_0009823 [Ascochyta rabiei]KZM20047.1 hypothetical protein ST47_g8815 [Ascochyta rabiei]UPX19564.1 hypothetical protein EKO05_0009823 [Ascochyta rabiei]
MTIETSDRKRINPSKRAKSAPRSSARLRPRSKPRGFYNETLLARRACERGTSVPRKRKASAVTKENKVASAEEPEEEEPEEEEPREVLVNKMAAWMGSSGYHDLKKKMFYGK